MKKETGMDRQRREMLRTGAGMGVWALLVGAGLVEPAWAASRDEAAFAATSLEAALAALGAQDARASDAIRIVAPDVAEDGRTVALTVSSAVPATEQIVIVIEENPYKVAASFRLSGAMKPEIQTRVKMARTTRVHALVKAEGRIFAAHRDVKVTVGGCSV